MATRRTTRNQSEVTRDFNAMISTIDALEYKMVEGARYGMQIASERVYADAYNTQAYDDDTGATRASTAVYVSDGEQPWPHGLVAISRNEAEVYRPGSGTADNAPPPPDRYQLVLDVITSTDYSYLLNIRFGGRSMFLANAVLGNFGVMMDLVAKHAGNAFATTGVRP